MHETSTDGNIGFFCSFFIYNLFDLELQIKSHEFLKFKLYSGISYIRINPEINLLRQPCVRMTSGSTGTSRSNLIVGPGCQGN